MNKLKGYRNMMNNTQQDFANMLSISRETYNLKENKKFPFTDKEKIILKDYIQERCKVDITIDELFF